MLHTYGRRRDPDRVVVKLDRTRARTVVEYRDIDQQRRRRFFGIDKAGQHDAHAWFQQFVRERAELRKAHDIPAAITLRALWRLYIASPAWADLREKTRISYAARWKTWELVIGPDTDAAHVTIREIDYCTMRLRAAGRAINQVRQVLTTARTVFNWGQSRRVLGANDFALYRWKQPKDAKVESPGEYSQAEFDAILGQLPPQHARLWRAHVVWMLSEAQGPRANAVLHLKWADIHDGAIHWPAEYQKNGRAHTQPLTWDAWAALETARYWQERAADPRPHMTIERRERRLLVSTSPYVVPAVSEKRHVRGQPWGYQAMWKQIREAEDRAGVQHERYRLLHGNRRKAAGDVIKATGDRMLGLEWVGDSSAQVLKSYDKRLQDRLGKAAMAKDNT